MPQEEYDQTEPEYKFNDEDDAVYSQDEEAASVEGTKEETTETSIDNTQGEKKFGFPFMRGTSNRKIIFFIIAMIVVFIVIYKLSSVVHVSKNKKQQREQALSSIVAPSVPKEMGLSSALLKPADHSQQEIPINASQAGASSVLPDGAVNPTSSITPASQAIQGLTEPSVISSSIQPVQSTQNVQNAQNTENKEFEAKMMVLQETNERLNNTLREQQTETQMRLLSLEQKMAGLNSSLEQLQESITAVSTQVKENKSLQSALMAYQKNKEVSKNKQERQVKQYFVQAVIPGRAWLHGADGSMITVTVGDYIPGYGKVASIDAYSGTVETTSGIEIRYGLNL